MSRLPGDRQDRVFAGLLSVQPEHTAVLQAGEMPGDEPWSHRHLMQTQGVTEDSPFTDYRLPSLDSLFIPRDILYLVMATIIVVLVAYAIVGHLINDLVHDFADWAFGPKLDEKKALDDRTDGRELSASENSVAWQDANFSVVVEGCEVYHMPSITWGPSRHHP